MTNIIPTVLFDPPVSNHFAEIQLRLPEYLILIVRGITIRTTRQCGRSSRRVGFVRRCIVAHSL
jgi:hypothetical protein